MSLEEEDNQASGSDSDDEDYVPTGGNEALSEDESGNESQSAAGSEGEEEEENGGKRKKSLKKNNRTRKKMKPVEEKENEEEPSEELSFEEKRKRASSLWEDFMKDVGGPANKNKVDEPSSVAKPVDKVPHDSSQTTSATSQQPAKTKVTEIFEFAGEKVEVEREVPTTTPTLLASKSSGRGRPASGISGILGQLGKKGKLSTLEKSKLDWDKFKKQEGIDEELGTFNKGKNGFLEKQDFLRRADLRQFEIEKEMRNHRRNLNR